MKDMMSLPFVGFVPDRSCYTDNISKDKNAAHTTYLMFTFIGKVAMNFMEFKN